VEELAQRLRSDIQQPHLDYSDAVAEILDDGKVQEGDPDQDLDPRGQDDADELLQEQGQEGQEARLGDPTYQAGGHGQCPRQLPMAVQPPSLLGLLPMA